MRARTASAALLVVAGLLVAPASMAAADTATDARPGVTTSALAKAKSEARRLDKLAHAKKNVVLGGRVVSVAGDQLAFTAHGGRYKALRGTVVTVTVAPDAKITREGAVEGVPVLLSVVLVGDHVVVKSRDFAFSVVRAAADPLAPTVLTTTVTVAATVHRLAASPTDASVAPVVVPPVVPDVVAPVV